MEEPLISIIIPTYNRAQLIKETLDSVAAQTYGHWECIVVDDGSIDETEQLMQSYSRVDERFIFLKRKKLPKGASHCRNIGLDNAKGKYCIFLDSDDLLLENSLEQRLEEIKGLKENKFWVFPMSSQDIDGNLIENKIPVVPSYLEKFLSYEIYWGIMCTLWQREFLLRIGGFNINYPRLNDPEIHIRAILACKGNFKVFTELSPDSIYRWAASFKNPEIFAQNYRKSLLLFVPETVSKLKENSKEEGVPLLVSYLNNYMQENMWLNNRTDNLELFRIFYKNGILTHYQYSNIIFSYFSYLVSRNYLKKAKARLFKILN